MISQQIADDLCRRLELAAKKYEAAAEHEISWAFREAQKIVRDALRIPEGAGIVSGSLGVTSD